MGGWGSKWVDVKINGFTNFIESLCKALYRTAWGSVGKQGIRDSTAGTQGTRLVDWQ